MIFKFFHGRPLLLGMVLLTSSLLGVIGYVKMPRNMYPDVERPQVTVITQLPGASRSAWRRSCRARSSRSCIPSAISATCRAPTRTKCPSCAPSSTTRKGLDAALLDVNNALSRVRGKLPPDAPASSVYAVGASPTPVMVLAVSPKAGSSLSLTQVRLLAENDIRTALVTQPNIANVEVFGGYEPALRVEFDPLKLARYRITQAQLQELLGKLDRDWPVGTRRARTAA